MVILLLPFCPAPHSFLQKTSFTSFSHHRASNPWPLPLPSHTHALFADPRKMQTLNIKWWKLLECKYQTPPSLTLTLFLPLSYSSSLLLYSSFTPFTLPLSHSSLPISTPPLPLSLSLLPPYIKLKHCSNSHHISLPVKALRLPSEGRWTKHCHIFLKTGLQYFPSPRPS